MLSTTELNLQELILILPADVYIVSQQSFTSDVIHQSDTVRHLGSIRKEEEEEFSDF